MAEQRKCLEFMDFQCKKTEHLGEKTSKKTNSHSYMKNGQFCVLFLQNLWPLNYKKYTFHLPNSIIHAVDSSRWKKSFKCTLFFYCKIMYRWISCAVWESPRHIHILLSLIISKSHRNPLASADKNASKSQGRGRTFR